MYRDANLLSMAKDQPCLLRIPGVCCRKTDTVVAAHSNSAHHGKGKSIKAEDCYSVWACVTCHTWLDQSQAPRFAKEDAFLIGLERQVREWRKIADNICAKPRDVNSARAVLNYLERGDGKR